MGNSQTSTRFASDLMISHEEESNVRAIPGFDKSELAREWKSFWAKQWINFTPDEQRALSDLKPVHKLCLLARHHREIANRFFDDAIVYQNAERFDIASALFDTGLYIIEQLIGKAEKEDKAQRKFLLSLQSKAKDANEAQEKLAEERIPDKSIVDDAFRSFCGSSRLFERFSKHLNQNLSLRKKWVLYEYIQLLHSAMEAQLHGDEAFESNLNNAAVVFYTIANEFYPTTVLDDALRAAVEEAAIAEAQETLKQSTLKDSDMPAGEKEKVKVKFNIVLHSRNFTDELKRRLTELNFFQKRDVCDYFEKLYLGPVFNQTTTDAQIIENQKNQQSVKKKKAASLFTRSSGKEKDKEKLSKTPDFEKIEEAKKSVQGNEKPDLQTLKPEEEKPKSVERKPSVDKDLKKSPSRKGSATKKAEEPVDIPPPPPRESEAPPPIPRDSDLQEVNRSYKPRSSSVQMPSSADLQTSGRKSFDSNVKSEILPAKVMSELANKLPISGDDGAKKPSFLRKTSKDSSEPHGEKPQVPLSPVAEKPASSNESPKEAEDSKKSEVEKRKSKFVDVEEDTSKAKEKPATPSKDQVKDDSKSKSMFVRAKDSKPALDELNNKPKVDPKASPKPSDELKHKNVEKARASEFVSKSAPVTPEIPSKTISTIAENDSVKAPAVVSGNALSMQERRAAIKDMMTNLESKGAPMPFGRQAAVPLALRKKKERDSLAGTTSLIDSSLLSPPIHRSKSPSISSEDLVAKVDPLPAFRHRADTSTRLDKEVPAAPQANEKAKLSDLNDVLLSRPVVKNNRRAPKKKQVELE